MFIGRLGFLFSTMYAGLTSLILQVHAFITIALATLFLGERPSIFQFIWTGLAKKICWRAWLGGVSSRFLRFWRCLLPSKDRCR
jgi:hypothetical protein